MSEPAECSVCTSSPSLHESFAMRMYTSHLIAAQANIPPFMGLCLQMPMGLSGH